MSRLMKQEIFATPEHLKDTARNARAAVEEIARLVKAGNIRHIFLAARGSSANAGLYFQYLCETAAGIAVTQIPPSVITVYQRSVDMTGGLLIAISQGGKGVDIRMVAQEAKRQGVPTVAVTNFPDSPLAAVCSHVIPLSVGLEQSMAATKSFTAELLVLNMLGCALAGIRDQGEGAGEAFGRGLSRAGEIAGLCRSYAEAGAVYVLGRGKTLALAKECCCKLQETCLLSAFPFSAAEFMHGPMALVDAGSRVLFLHSRYASSESTMELLSVLKKQKAGLLLITDDPKLADAGVPFLLLEGSSEEETVFAMTAVLQLFAAELSDFRGTDPDTSRNLNKYTQTV